MDYTALPKLIDRRFDQLDEDSAVRPTIIKPGDVWTKRSQAGLLSDMQESLLGEEEHREERERAYDLLDALSRSGSLPVDCAELHVVLAATHCFDQSLINTVIRGNINPIERAERSALIMASTVHGLAPDQLIADGHIARIAEHSPRLLTEPLPRAGSSEG